jgi:hypothetical protein
MTVGLEAALHRPARGARRSHSSAGAGTGRRASRRGVNVASCAPLSTHLEVGVSSRMTRGNELLRLEVDYDLRMRGGRRGARLPCVSPGRQRSSPKDLRAMPHAASALSSRVAALQTATATPCPSKPCTWQRTWNTFTLAFLNVCTQPWTAQPSLPRLRIALTSQHRRPSSASFCL